ncbi:PQQ-binding-like beta-propeller repeat protein, partial [Natronoarchaeum mannanilyticum]
ARTAAAPEMNPPTGEPSVEWTAEVESAPNEGVTALVVGDGTAFLGGDFRIAAVDLADGSRLWDADAPAEHLCYRDGVLYCVSIIHGGGLVALDAADGRTHWTFSEGGSTDVHDLLVVGDAALVGTHGQLVAHDARDGTVAWRLNVGGSGKVHPAVADNTLYVGGPGPLAAYRSREGWNAVREATPRRTERDRSHGPPFVTHPVVTDDSVYVGGHVDPFEEITGAAFSRSGLSHRWNGPTGNGLTSPVPIDDVGVVRIYHHGDNQEYELVGVDLDDGETEWSINRNAQIAPPVGAGELAFTCSADGAVLAIDPGTGRIVWETTVDGSTRAVVPAGERLLVADASGTVRCLR